MILSLVRDNRASAASANPVDGEPRLPFAVWEEGALFDGVSAAQVATVKSYCDKREFAPGEYILREGSWDDYFYIVNEGVAEVTKNTSIGDAEMRITEVGSGDVLGELKIVDMQPSSASVVAVTPVVVLAMDINVFAQSPAFADARAIMLRNVAKILAARLRAATGRGADAMQRELEESRARAHAGRFMVLMFTALAVYQLAISALELVPHRVSFTVLSFAFVIWSAMPIALTLPRSPFSLDSYGLTLRHGGQVALQAVFWTAPLLLLMLVLKAAWIHWVPSMADQPLFNPQSEFSGTTSFSIVLYVLAICTYSIHAPLQELIARGGLQGTLQNFIPTPPGVINWQAIVISNLLFAASHAFIGFWFCLAAFVPGVFWGWMFAKQRSLIGVIISHIMVGVWALYILGARTIIGG